MKKSSFKQRAKKARQRKGAKLDGKWHVRLYHWMLQTKAWISLSAVEKALYVEISTYFNGSNNGEVWLSVRDAAKALHIGKSTASKAFKSLAAKGFIRPKQRGAFQWKMRHSTCWVLTEHEYAGAPATKDFIYWPDKRNKITVPVEGQSEPNERQTDQRYSAEFVICTYEGTTGTESETNLAAHGYADSIPSRGCQIEAQN